MEAGDQSAEKKQSDKDLTPSPAQEVTQDTSEKNESESVKSEEKSAEQVPSKIAEIENQEQQEKEVETPQKEETSIETESIAQEEATEESVDKAEPKVETEAPSKVESSSEEQKTEVSKDAEANSPSDDIQTDKGEESTEDNEQEEEEEEEHDENEELPDYTTFTRDQLVELIEELTHVTTFKRTTRILDQIVPLFFGMEDERKALALSKYKEEGGEEDTFEFRHDEDYNRFDASLTLIKDRKSNFYKEKEASKAKNLEKKEDILAQLRELIDGENATTNLSPIKKLQEEWKAVGPVPAQHNRTLWANYNALLDRFYNNRHILFELKELDRKKNHKAKMELCEKAEVLDKYGNIKDAVIELNELHEEYKRIGAVPREVQEELWQRFKSASDKIYKKRKSYLEDLKGEFEENAEKKRTLAKELEPFVDFDSDRINEWNSKTKEILAIQKRWDAIGGVPREEAKEINKLFWSTFKKFFSNKNEFFKRLESLRKENLSKKEQLVEQAKELSESGDLEKTADQLKRLQKEWREIGPVPEKFRNSVYAKFKEACDQFFDKKRAAQNEHEAQYQENLKQKEAILDQMMKSAKGKKGTEEEFTEMLGQFTEIGFVPRNAIKSTESKLKEAVETYIESIGLSEDKAQEIMLKAEFGGQKGAGVDKKLNKKESVLRRKIKELEDNISLLNNNLAFFANSKTADKLKAEFDEKINKAQEEIDHLKKQLRVIRNL